MILLVDAGNSRLKWALAPLNGQGDEFAWIGQGSLANDQLAELPALWQQLPIPQAVIGSNVAGPGPRHAVEAAAGPWHCPVRWAVPEAFAGGLRNAYEQPGQLGADRWVSLIAAFHRVRGGCVVVNAGTATTIDTVSGQGIFLGGMILPGVALMRKALAAGTAGLGLRDGAWRAMPRNTADAIQTGCIQAQLGAIALARATQTPATALVLAGGESETLAPHIAAPLVRVPNLVLEGLLILAREGHLA
jgi:type III pantothenate kinase